MSLSVTQIVANIATAIRQDLSIPANREALVSIVASVENGIASAVEAALPEIVDIIAKPLVAKVIAASLQALNEELTKVALVVPTKTPIVLKGPDGTVTVTDVTPGA